ncbi:MAG: hypothetical protein A3F54_02690 [Candidatus Kerfeldbacteria bacterium RIFCSPHIGHO2_12_FULL_48_17]|uniref:Uncharacterized protein n=1 Tax=Candidatus Kerfeldbacteria bacterium RIFCSPHIGHO2_12_FULL_48_17 TaxID=1798542 RepID=A0A1G2BA60_9BACT|nr:MAG: hypothetical protein A3F54_02690 [Candidatus Kerfeldbacteria bacterium RIFCSPHIGHO2_12_FULL_48_17]
MPFYPGPVNPQFSPFSGLNLETYRPPGLEPAPLDLGQPLPPGFTPQNPLQAMAQSARAANLPKNYEFEEYEKQLEKLKTKQRLEEITLMSPAEFSALRQGVMDSPDFAEAKEDLDRQRQVALQMSKIPATPDLSPLAGLFGVSPEPYRGTPGGLGNVMASLETIRKGKRELLKSATDATRGMIKGKAIDETGKDSMAEFFYQLGTKTSRSGGANPLGLGSSRQVITDFMNSPAMQKYSERKLAMDNARSFIENIGTSASMEQVGYFIAKNLDPGGRLSDLDFLKASSDDRTLAMQAKKYYQMWMRNEPLPENKHYARITLEALRNSDERWVDDKARSWANISEKHYRTGGMTKKEIYEELRPGSSWAVPAREAQAEEKTKQESEKQKSSSALKHKLDSLQKDAGVR